VKRCPRCEIVKPLDAFNKSGSNRDGRQGYCKPCYVRYERERHQQRLAADPDFHRKRNLKATFGLEWEDYQAMLEQQGHRCASCRLEFERTPHVDHNHRTDRIRAILCHRCNTALGQLRDDPYRVRALLTYIKAQNPEDGNLSQRYMISETNPNDGVGGGGCLCSEVKCEDCVPPYAIFPNTEMSTNLSPHVVVSIHCARKFVEDVDAGAETIRAGEVIDGDAEELVI